MADKLNYRLMPKRACIVAVGTWEGSKCLLKTRDRNYEPKLKIYHEIRGGVEVLYVKDEGTGWIEGINEFGIGVVNSALMVGRDEAEKKIVKTVGKKSKDGARILKALEAKTLEKAVETACNHQGGIKGHSFISDADKTVSVEATSKHECVTKTVRTDQVHVRTNHGFHYEDSGYTDGDDYVSSVYRRDKAKEMLRKVDSPTDLAPTMYAKRKGKGEMNSVIRDTDNMRTTSQLVLDLTKRILYLYLIPGQFDFEGVKTDFPKDYKPKLHFHVYKYDKKDKAKAVKTAAVELLPIMDPQWNLREVCKQLILLEDHLFHPRKRCMDCIRKHLLTAEGLAEETITLDVDRTFQGATTGLADSIREAWTMVQDVRNDGAPGFTEIAQSVRKIRKGLVEVCYHVRVAACLNEPDEPSAARVTSAFENRVAAYFNVGDVIFFGKYKNKKGLVIRFYRDERGLPYVEVEPIPKGRKKNRQIGLFKIWHQDMEKRGTTRQAGRLIQFPDHSPARPKHTETIGGTKYALSSDGGPLGDLVEDEDEGHAPGMGPRVIRGPQSRPFKFLWAYDTERGDMGMWRVTDGNEKVYGGADNFRSKLIKLDKQGELNRVTNAEMRTITREMRKRETEQMRSMEKWIEEHKTEYQALVDVVAQEVFDKDIQPNLERRLAELDKGVVPFGFKVIEQILDHESEASQMRAHVISSATVGYTIDLVEDELRRRGIDPDAEGHDIQAAHWAVEDIRLEAWKQYKRASSGRVAAKHQDKLPGGRADKRKPSDFDPKELAMGIEVEKEHVGDNKGLAREIAMDHLVEIDDYYSRLKEMEGEAGVKQGGGCYQNSTSFAWIDPQGKVYDLNGLHHPAWAARHLNGESEDPSTELQDRGWIRVINEFRVVVSDINRVSHKAWQAYVGILLDCVWLHGPEKKGVVDVYSKGRWQDSSIADFIEKFGTKKQMDKLFEALLDKVAAKYQNKKKVKKQDGDEMTVYEYSEGQIGHRNREKAKRIEKLRKGIGSLRTQVKKDLGSKDNTVRLSALAVALLDETFERVGNDGSAKDGHFGVTGWKVEHVTFKGNTATFKYVGKSGVEQSKTVSNAKVVSALKTCCKGKGKKDRILCEADGTCRVSSREVNAYLKPHNITAKDIRGLHANEQMRAELKKARKGKLPTDKKERDVKLKEEFKTALAAAASAVGHEPATLKGQYLVPGLEDSFLKDGTVPTSLSKTGATLPLQMFLGRSGHAVVKMGLPQGRLHIRSKGRPDKPTNAFWTSSLKGSSTAWMDYCWENNPDWVGEKGALFKVKPGAKVLWIKSPADYQQVLEDYPLFPGKKLAVDWAAVAKDYDGATCPRGQCINAWDVESTAWFNMRALELLRFVNVDGACSIPDTEEWEDPRFRLAGVLDLEAFTTRLATKTRQEKEDEDVNSLIRKSPSKKPPRKDLHNRRLKDHDDADDGDAKQDRKDQSQNWKDGSLRRAWDQIGKQTRRQRKKQRQRQQRQRPPTNTPAKPKGHANGETWQTDSGKWSGKSKDGKQTQGGFEEEAAAKVWIETGKMPPKDDETSDKAPAEDAATPTPGEAEKAEKPSKARKPSLTGDMEENVTQALVKIKGDRGESRNFQKMKLDQQVALLTGQRPGRGQRTLDLARELVEFLKDSDPKTSNLLKHNVEYQENYGGQFSKLSPEEKKAEKLRVQGVLKPESEKRHGEYKERHPNTELTPDDFLRMLNEDIKGYNGTLHVNEKGEILDRDEMRAKTDAELQILQEDRDENIKSLEKQKKEEGVDKVLKETTKLVKHLLEKGRDGNSDLPPDFQTKMRAKLDTMNSTERQEFMVSMAATVAEFPKDPPMGMEAVEAGRKALGADFRKKSPTVAGKVLAQALYAERVTFNPLMLNATAVSIETEPSSDEEAASDMDRHTQRSLDAKSFYSQANREERNNAIAQVDEALRSLNPKSPRAQELTAIKNGIALAAVIKGEEPSGVQVSEQFMVLASAMASIGEENRFLGTVSDLSSDEGQEALRDALSTMTDREISDYIGGIHGDHPYASIAEGMLKRTEDGSAFVLGKADREQMREWIVTTIIEDIVFMDPLVGDYLEANGEESTMETRKKVKEELSEEVYEKAAQGVAKAVVSAAEGYGDLPSGTDNEDRPSTKELAALLESLSNDVRNAQVDGLKEKFSKTPETDNVAIANAARKENSNAAITQRKIKPGDKVKKVKRKPGTTWQSPSGWWGQTPENQQMGPFEDKAFAEAWADGTVGDRQKNAGRKLQAVYDFTPWRELPGA